MGDEYLINYCAPTLAGIKTGSLFTIYPVPGEDVYGEVRRLNHMLRRKGLRALLCRNCVRYALIYIYRPNLLKKDLDDPEAANILADRGYCLNDPDRCIVQLLEHLKKDSSFPHEIGLFLGYPPSDVSAFMNDPKAGVKQCGYWKVYSNEKNAEKTFRKYRMCTDTYRTLYKKGRTLEELTVKV